MALYLLHRAEGSGKLFPGPSSIHVSETDDGDGSTPTLEVGDTCAERMTTSGGLREEFGIRGRNKNSVSSVPFQCQGKRPFNT